MKWCIFLTFYNTLRKKQLYRQAVLEELPAFKKVAERRFGAFLFNLSIDYI